MHISTNTTQVSLTIWEASGKQHLLVLSLLTCCKCCFPREQSLRCLLLKIHVYHTKLSRIKSFKTILNKNYLRHAMVSSLKKLQETWLLFPGCQSQLWRTRGWEVFSFEFTPSDTFVFICRLARLLHKFSHVPVGQILGSDCPKLCSGTVGQIWTMDIISILIILIIMDGYWSLGPRFVRGDFWSKGETWFPLAALHSKLDPVV